MKNGDLPANVLVDRNGGLWNFRYGSDDSRHFENPNNKFSFGLTKRERFAMAAMQGILSNGVDFTLHEDKDVAQAAIIHADNLLAELEQSK